MKQPLRDIVIVVPAITGSVLEKDGWEVWSLSSGALWRTATTLGGSLRALAMRGEDPGVGILLVTASLPRG